MADLSHAFGLEKRRWWRISRPRPTSADQEAYRLRLLVGMLAAGAAFFLLFAVGLLGMGLVLGALTVLLLVALLIWAKPWWGLLLLVTLAPLHQFIMMLIYNYTESTLILRLAQMWKETVLLVLLLKSIDLAFRRGKPPRITLLDLLIISYATLTVIYIFVPSSVESTNLIAKIYGARTDMMFLLPVFLARGLRINRRQVQILLGITIAVSLLIALVAAFQVAAPGLSNEVFDSLGYSKYVKLQRGLSDGIYAVRQREVSGLRLTRAASLLMGDLALAFYQLITVPIALALFLILPGIRTRVFGNLYVLSMIGTLAFTVTRSAIAGAIAACGIMVLWQRRVGLAALILLQIAVLLIGLAIAMDLTPARLSELFSLEESSSRAHFNALEGGWRLLKEDPWGRGLGTSGTIGQRFTPLGGFTPESWYFQIANEMGVGQALLFIAITILFGWTCFQRYTQLRDPWLRALSLGVGGGIIGFAIVGIVLHAWEALTPAMLFWFLGGIVLAAPDIEQSTPEPAPAGR